MHLFPFVLMAFALTGCLEIEPEDVQKQPVAHFLVDRYIYETGEKIAFENRSINAESYHWEFGDGETAEAENPVKTYKLPEDKHYQEFVVTLTAENAEGSTNTFSETLHVGKRFLREIAVGSVTFTDSAGNNLEADNLLDIYLYFGHKGDKNSHSIAEKRSTTTRQNISQDAFPLIFSFPEQSAYILDNTTWFLEVYEDDGNVATNYRIAEFEFNPTQRGIKSSDGSEGYFTLENANCSMEIGFSVKYED